MNKWEKYYKIYKNNPIKFCEDYLGVKLTRIQKIRLNISNSIYDYLYKLLKERKDLLREIILEPYGTLRYDVLKLHSAILELKIDIVKSILKNVVII